MNDIVKFKNPKWCMGVMLIIILSAIACGVWEFALRPIALKFQKIVFTIITFGSKSAADSFYQSAAGGHQPIFGLLFLSLGFLACAALMWLIYKWHHRILEEAALVMAYKRLEDTDDAGSIEKIKQAIRAEEIKNIKDRKFSRYCIIFMVLFAAFFLLVIGSVKSQQEITVSQFEHYMNICKPYLKVKEEEQLLSRFSQIQTRKDYEIIMVQLVDIALKNDLECPKVYIF